MFMREESVREAEKKREGAKKFLWMCVL